jgi:hypothetical protein
VSFKDSGGLFAPTMTSGVRAWDMALRLKYDDIKADDVQPDLSASLNDALGRIKKGETLIIYTTYTAMLSLRKILTKITKVERI